MVKLTKIVTKTGDQGETSLAGGHRISKTATRIHAIGSVDELNSQLGLSCALFPDASTFDDIKQYCANIQQNLFNLGAELCVLTADRRDNTPVVTDQAILQIESNIDAINEQLPTLTSFILPSGHPCAASFFLTRAVCRRTERDCLTLVQTEEGVHLERPLIFLNRLSDWLFVAARWINLTLNHSETQWVS